MVTLLLRVLSHSSAIQPLLDIPTTRGTIHSVFSGAANLLFGGQLLTLHAREMPCAPNGLVLPLRARRGPLADLQVGMVTIIERGMISMPAPGLRLSTQNSRSWNPRPQLASASCSPEHLARNVDYLASLVTTKADANGLAGLANLRIGASVPIPPGQTLLLQTAWPATEQMLAGISRRQMQLVYQAAGTLLGLGPGLTPSGDDLLVGLMAAIILLSEPLGLRAEFYQRLSAELLTIARGRTNKLSMTWMEYARRGEVAEHLGRLFHTLILDDLHDLEDATIQVLNTGATSGGDVLAGVILGSRCLIEQSKK
jgi:hypothetical protein